MNVNLMHQDVKTFLKKNSTDKDVSKVCARTASASHRKCHAVLTEDIDSDNEEEASFKLKELASSYL